MMQLGTAVAEWPRRMLHFVLDQRPALFAKSQNRVSELLFGEFNDNVGSSSLDR